MTYNIADLDIDVKNRDEILQYFKYIPASKISNNSIFPHGVGVYFCDIPQDLVSGLASIDYKKAEEQDGFVKIDLLHNTVYDRFNTRTEIEENLSKPIKWELLYNQEFVEKLPHIGNYYTLLNQMPKIDSIENLARFIAIIRPSKKYLIDVVKETKSWDSVSDKIWIKEEDNGYMYKHSHSIAYAMMITLYLK